MLMPTLYLESDAEGKTLNLRLEADKSTQHKQIMESEAKYLVAVLTKWLETKEVKNVRWAIIAN